MMSLRRADGKRFLTFNALDEWFRLLGRSQIGGGDEDERQGNHLGDEPNRSCVHDVLLILVG